MEKVDDERNGAPLVGTKEEKERSAVGDESEDVGTEVYNTFDDMGVKETLLRGIYGMGYERPSAIQQRAIVPVFRGHDCICQSQSGTGKTAAFCTGVLERMDLSLREAQAIVLSPTRELAKQTYNVLSSIASYMEGIKVHLLIGGRGQPSNRTHAQMLEEGVHVVVGTPGRVLQMVADLGALRVHALKMLVLDEADEMLSMGFQEQIYDLVKYLPEEMQLCLFSATMPEEALALTKKFMRNPVKILVKREDVTLLGIEQFFVNVEREEYKVGTLMDLYEQLTITQAVIFCNMKRKCDWIAEKMTENDFTVSVLHGEMDQQDRDLVAKEFRSGTSRVLITTDVLARGFDCQQVNLVINYDLPRNRENYIHRIGRSGRFGRKGVAINFVTAGDLRTMRDIESYYHTLWTEMPADFDIASG